MAPARLGPLACALGALLSAPTAARGLESKLLDDLEAVGSWRPLSGQPGASLSCVEGAPQGKGALRVVLAESSKPQFVGRSFPAGAEWNEYQGFSFRFKGDGSDGFVAVSLIDETFTKRYAALVSLKPAEWRVVRLRWEDFVPEVVTADWFGAPGSGMKPADIRAFWFGRWFYFKPWSASVFEVDELRLEPRIEVPAAPAVSEPGIARTLAKLRAKKPVTIVALGDSITFGTHVKARDRDAWPGVLQALLRAKFGYEEIRVLNKGIGGIETRHGIALIPRDVTPFDPDLVTLHFGYNDFSSMQEKRFSPEALRKTAAGNWREAVARVRAATSGPSDVLLIATVPGADEARRESMDFFGDEARVAAAELKCGFTEEPRRAFQAAWKEGKQEDLFVRFPDGKLDVAHPNEKGQRVFAEALLKAFE